LKEKEVLLKQKGAAETLSDDKEVQRVEALAMKEARQNELVQVVFLLYTRIRLLAHNFNLTSVGSEEGRGFGNGKRRLTEE